MTNEIFSYKDTYDGEGLILVSYRQRLPFLLDDSISEVTIPAKHDGKPVVAIGKSVFMLAGTVQKLMISEGIRVINEEAFVRCSSLRSVSLPASLERLGSRAFHSCDELCDVEFKSNPIFGKDVFGGDFKLPAEIFLAGLVCSRDITRPLNEEMLCSEIAFIKYLGNVLDVFTWFRRRPDVFALAAQNDCFREISAELLDELIEYCVKEKMVEQTAYFLDLKKRKFGFEGGNGLVL